MTVNKSFVLILTIALYLASSLVFDLVFDDSYDSFASNLSSLQFTNFSLFDQHYLGVIGVRDLLKIVQNNFPQVNVFSSAYILLTLLAFYYLAYSVHALQKGRQIYKYVLITLFFSLFIENVVSITHTRFATVLCGVAMVNLYSKPHLNRKFLLHTGIFLFGFLIRPESGMGAVLIVGMAYLIFDFNFIRSIRVNALPILFTSVFFISLYTHKQFTNRFEILIEPDLEYMLSTGRVVPIDSMSNSMDSLRYQMATSGMFIDTSFVSVSFIESLRLEKGNFDFLRFQDSLQDIIDWYVYYLYCLILVISGCVFLFINKRWFLLSKFILYHLFVFMLLVLLDYNVDVADRHFISLQIVVILISFLFLSKWSQMNMGTGLRSIGFLITVVGIVFTVKNSLGNQVQVKRDVECVENAMNLIENQVRNETIIVTHNTFHLLDKSYTFFNSNYVQNDYLLFDVSNYSIVPRNLAFLSKTCSCNAHKPEEFINWAINKECFFLIDSSRMGLTKQYMEEVHNIPIQYVPIDIERPSCLSNLVYPKYFLCKVISEN